MKRKKQQLHPSGLTLERWAWPFKTEAERAIVAKWLKRQPKDKPLYEEALL